MTAFELIIFTFFRFCGLHSFEYKIMCSAYTVSEQQLEKNMKVSGLDGSKFRKGRSATEFLDCFVHLFSIIT